MSIWGDTASIWGGSVSIWGDTASIWGDTASIWGDTASIWGGSVSIWGDTASTRGDTASTRGDTEVAPYRWAVGKVGRDLDHGLVDEHRHRVEVAGVALQPQPLRRQGQGAAAGKGIVEGGQLVRVEEFGGAGVVPVIGAGGASDLPDFVAGLIEHVLVGGVLPPHQLLDDLEEAQAFDFLCFQRRELVRVCRRVVHHLGEDHRAGSRQRSPRPPEMQRGGVAVADGFLRALATLITSRGRATSMSFLRVCTALLHGGLNKPSN
jgi:hypothetical protein